MRTSMQASAAALSLGVATLTFAARAQCPTDWLTGESICGINGSISAMFAWDADGAGSALPLLVAGGTFTVAGDRYAKNIAVWNGQRWDALGAGLPDQVSAINDFNGDLVAATFATGRCHVFRWSAGAWTQLGGDFDNSVLDMATFNNQLVVGGAFQTYGAASMRRMAHWDGASWQEFAGGAAGLVNALERDGTTLLAGGGFQSIGGVTAARIARWNNVQWATLGPGFPATNSSVTDIAVHSGVVYAATNVGVRRFNGATWESVGNPSPQSARLAFNGGVLHAAGSFFSEAYGRYVSRFDGTAWSQFGPQVNSSVSAICAYDGKIAIGGAFQSAGTTPLAHATLWNGATYESLGPGWGMFGPFPPKILWFGEDRNQLIAAGYFQTTPGGPHRYLARRVGAAWAPFSAGDGPSGIVNVITRDADDRLLIAGYFGTVDGLPAKHLAAWDGSSWSGFGPGFTGSSGPGVFAAVVYNGSLYVGGHFTAVDDHPTTPTPMRYIARWNGAAWNPVGGGTDGDVDSLALYDGRLIAVGGFSSAGTTPASRIASWNGAVWEPLGAGLNSGPNPGYYALHADNGLLYVGGAFTMAGDQSVNNFAIWDGTAWHGGLDLLGGAVYTLEMHDDRLIAGGTFTSGNSQSLPRLAALGPTGWEPVGGAGVDNIVYALASFDGELHVGGLFNVLQRGTQFDAAVCYTKFGPQCPPGDADCDGSFTNFDIDPFVLALVDPLAYAAVYPNCPQSAIDVNHDGRFDNFDIDPFVTCLVSGCP